MRKNLFVLSVLLVISLIASTVLAAPKITEKHCQEMTISALLYQGVKMYGWKLVDQDQRVVKKYNRTLSLMEKEGMFRGLNPVVAAAVMYANCQCLRENRSKLLSEMIPPEKLALCNYIGDDIRTYQDVIHAYHNTWTRLSGSAVVLI
jgi:hypothetical protein